MQKNLAGMGSAVVRIIDDGGRRCVSKDGASPVEVQFYRYVAAQVRLAGIGVPEVLAIDDNSLLLEYIPFSLALDELNSDARAYRQLAILHGLELAPVGELKVHSWTEEHTERALARLRLPRSSENILRYFQRGGSGLFAAGTFISGDANAGNWGRRAEGDLVIYDWERFGRGSPAIDLAPLVPGMGCGETFARVARSYRAACEALAGSSPPLAQLISEIVLAKAWIFVEVVNILVAGNHPATAKYLAWYKAVLPRWLREVAISAVE